MRAPHCSESGALDFGRGLGRAITAREPLLSERTSPDDHYIEPGWLTRNVNRAVGLWLAHQARRERVRQPRASCGRPQEWNSAHDGGRRRRRPLPPRSPRHDAVGPQPSGRRHGRALRRPSVEDSSAEKLPDDAKTPVLSAYIVRWGWEVGQFFEAVGKDPSSMPSQRSPRSFPCSPSSGSCRRLRVRSHRWLTPLG